MTDRHPKLLRALPTAQTSATHVSNILLEHWSIPFGIPSYVLTDDGPQFVIKRFAAIYKYLGVKYVTETAYFLQTDGQIERNDKNNLT